MQIQEKTRRNGASLQKIDLSCFDGCDTFWGTKFLGTICPWGLNWLGTVSPEGPINWGPIVGDQMSGDHMCLGPNVSQPIQSPA